MTDKNTERVGFSSLLFFFLSLSSFSLWNHLWENPEKDKAIHHSQTTQTLKSPPKSSSSSSSSLNWSAQNPSFLKFYLISAFFSNLFFFSSAPNPSFCCHGVAIPAYRSLGGQKSVTFLAFFPEFPDFLFASF